MSDSRASSIEVRTILLTLALLLVGGTIPAAMHGLGVRCWVYLPAHIVPLLAGLVLGSRGGLLVGAGVGIADWLLGGALQGPRAYAVMTELATYGLVAGVLRPRPWTLLRGTLALVGAMLAGRVAYLTWALALGRTLKSALPGLFLTPWPGILFQLAVLPMVATLLIRVVRAEETFQSAQCLKA